eukprot:768554-Hanusia_phi.AAC.11
MSRSLHWSFSWGRVRSNEGTREGRGGEERRGEMGGWAPRTDVRSLPPSSAGRSDTWGRRPLLYRSKLPSCCSRRLRGNCCPVSRGTNEERRGEVKRGEVRRGEESWEREREKLRWEEGRREEDRRGIVSTRRGGGRKTEGGLYQRGGEGGRKTEGGLYQRGGEEGGRQKGDCINDEERREGAGRVRNLYREEEVRTVESA